MSPSLEILKPDIGQDPEQSAVIDPTLTGGFGQDHHRKPLPALALLWFCVSVRVGTKQFLESPEENCSLT